VSRWKLILLLHTEPVTALTALVHGEPETLHMVWCDMRWRTVVYKVRVVSIATQREPILLVSTDVTDTQYWSGSHGVTCHCTHQAEVIRRKPT